VMGSVMRVARGRTAVAVLGVAVMVVSSAVAAAGALATTGGPPAPVGEWAPHELLVEYRAASSARDVREGVESAGAHVERTLGTPWAPGRRLVLVESTERSVPELMDIFREDPLVVRVSPNYRDRVCDTTPNDTSYGSQWGLPKIAAPAAWDTTTGSSDVVIADIDTGVDYNHPDLAANMWHNPNEIAANGVDDDGNGYVDDVYGIDSNAMNGDPFPKHSFADVGHGTHVAGICAAVGNNGTGITGTMWSGRIMAIQTFSSDGTANQADEITAIDYVIHEKTHDGVDVAAINASWGGYGSADPLVRDAIRAAGDAGIVFCAAAGNDHHNNDSTPYYPSSYTLPCIIAVAASDASDDLAGFSNYGVTSVDLAAPGVDILSTLPGNSYAAWEGTSMATPFVTGSVGLCAAQHPAETANQRVARIVKNVDAVSGLSGTCVSGGRLNVNKAVGAAAPSLDDEIPGVVITASPVTDTVDSSSDVDDVFSIDLNAGDLVEASIDGAAGSDFDLYLFPPGAASVVLPGSAVARATGASYPDSLAYAARTTGTYYLDVHAGSGGGAYTLTYAVTPDTSRPTTKAWAPRTGVPRYGPATIRYRLIDTPGVGRVYAQLLVKKASTGRTVKKVEIGWKSVNVTLRQRLKCSMAKGRYRVYIAGTTRDLADNPFQLATAYGILVVK